MNTATARRTQTDRRRESEDRLIRSAIDIIARHGVGALTFEAISRSSGMSRGSVTQRFGSKHGLIKAILLHLHDNQQARTQAQGLASMTGIEAICAYIDSSLTRMAQTSDARAYFLLLSSSLNEAGDLRAQFSETHAEVEHQLQSWIVQGQSAGDIAPDVAAKSTALMIGCILFGIAMQFMTDPGMNISPVREAVLQTLRKSLRA